MTSGRVRRAAAVQAVPASTWPSPQADKAILSWKPRALREIVVEFQDLRRTSKAAWDWVVAAFRMPLLVVAQAFMITRQIAATGPASRWMSGRFLFGWPWRSL